MQNAKMGFCGNNNTVNRLALLINASKRPHTYIFSGPEHVGKRRAAIFFLNALLKNKEIDTDDVAENHPDINILSDPSHKSVEVARKVRTFLSHSPLTGSSKGLIIDNSHLLGNLGANILLKSLEEPPHETYTVLVTHRPDLLPNTILSRSMSVRFTHVLDKEILQFFQGDKQNLISKELSWIAGRPGLLFEYLNSEKNEESLTVRKYSKTKVVESISETLDIAEKISTENLAHAALEGIFLSLWSRNNNGSYSKTMRSIILARENILRTNCSIRLAVEKALLS